MYESTNVTFPIFVIIILKKTFLLIRWKNDLNLIYLKKFLKFLFISFSFCVLFIFHDLSGFLIIFMRSWYSEIIILYTTDFY